mmetsp:Transcript_3377/g.13625  ORF Transcript_3377/g.13625 Transcript_3377/m.13625 type:complete len:261 (+) Transcript_3377:129-911(+)
MATLFGSTRFLETRNLTPATWSATSHSPSTAPFARIARSNAQPLLADPRLSSLNVTTPFSRNLCARASAVRRHESETHCAPGPPYTATAHGYGPGPKRSASGRYIAPCNVVCPSAEVTCIKTGALYDAYVAACVDVVDRKAAVESVRAKASSASVAFSASASSRSSRSSSSFDRAMTRIAATGGVRRSSRTSTNRRNAWSMDTVWHPAARVKRTGGATGAEVLDETGDDASPFALSVSTERPNAFSSHGGDRGAGQSRAR